jgi:multicomponent Na+:H+ antiporter subunit D
MAVSPETIDLSEALRLAPVPPGDWLVIAPVLVPLVAGAVLIALRTRAGLSARLLVPALALNLAVNLLLLVRVLSEGPLTMVMGRWLPPFGIAFTVDSLSAAFSFTGALAALAVGIFQRGEGRGPAPLYHPAPFVLMLVAGVSGAFLTGDLFNLYVWFEVLLISSFGLFALGQERAEIDGTLKYGFLNFVGTTLFLVAVGLTYGITGTLNMADLAGRLPMLPGAPLITLTALFLFALSMKAAAFPLHFWLPAAYHTPRAGSAALFAALLTKVGVYAILRVGGMLLPAPLESLSLLVAMVASLTMLFGALGVLQERDLKRLPGFVLISGIGTMLAGIALSSPGGTTGAIFYGLQSMLLMAGLYLALFEAARLAGTGDLMGAGGLYDRHPLLSGLVLALFFAASGLPPFSGFWPKALIVKAALDIGAWWLAAAVLISGFLLTIGLARAFLLAFWRPAAEPVTAKPPATPPLTVALSTALPLGLLGLLVLLLGIAPERLLAVSGHAAAGLADPTAYVQSVFPGRAW